MGSEKRRSDRLMLTVPLWVMGSHPKGFPFIEDARTISLNRDGALIHIFRLLRAGQTVLVFNLVTQREADFRVVGPIAPFTEKGGDYGIERLKRLDNIWGIRFPSPPEGGPNDPKAVLECRKCRSVELARLSLVEVEVLETAGILSRHCRRCRASRSWGFPEQKIAMEGPPGEAEMFAEAEAQVRAQARGDEHRRHRRVLLQLPVLVRNFEGENEITKTENASKSGFCFTSRKKYELGEGLIVACPYADKGKNLERPARIVRRLELEGLNRKVYGVRYEARES
jgi:hypothetical protein